MIVVSDTSPITTLLQVRRSDLLQKLFERVAIPGAVEAELHRFHYEIPGFLAKKRGILDSLARALDEIERVAGFYVDSAVKDRILRAAEEA